jgi:WD40 repeat protein
MLKKQVKYTNYFNSNIQIDNKIIFNFEKSIIHFKNNAKDITCMIILKELNFIVVSFYYKKSIHLYNINNHHLIKEINLETGNNYLSITKNNKLICSSPNGIISIIYINDNKYFFIQQSIKISKSSIFKCIEMNNQKLICCCDDKTIKILSLDKKQDKYFIESNVLLSNYSIFNIIEIPIKKEIMCELINNSIIFLNEITFTPNHIIKSLDLSNNQNNIQLIYNNIIVGGIKYIYLIKINNHLIIRKISFQKKSINYISNLFNNNLYFCGNYLNNNYIYKAEIKNDKLIYKNIYYIKSKYPILFLLPINSFINNIQLIYY